MADMTMGEIESRFADIIWQNEPISSGELAKRSEALLGWKKSTAFTVLKRLCNKGIFKTEGGVVTSLVLKEEFYSRQSRQFVNDAFKGSLPAFIAAFASGKRLSPEEVTEIKKMIDKFSEEG